MQLQTIFRMKLENFLVMIDLKFSVMGYLENALRYTTPPLKSVKTQALIYLRTLTSQVPRKIPRVAFWMPCDFTPWVACSQTLHFLLKVRRACSPIIEKKNKETSVCRLRFGRHLGLAGCHNWL